MTLTRTTQFDFSSNLKLAPFWNFSSKEGNKKNLLILLLLLYVTTIQRRDGVNLVSPVAVILLE